MAAVINQSNAEWGPFNPPAEWGSIPPSDAEGIGAGEIAWVLEGVVAIW